MWPIVSAQGWDWISTGILLTVCTGTAPLISVFVQSVQAESPALVGSSVTLSESMAKTGIRRSTMTEQTDD